MFHVKRGLRAAADQLEGEILEVGWGDAGDPARLADRGGSEASELLPRLP